MSTPIKLAWNIILYIPFIGTAAVREEFGLGRGGLLVEQLSNLRDHLCGRDHRQVGPRCGPILPAPPSSRTGEARTTAKYHRFRMCDPSGALT